MSADPLSAQQHHRGFVAKVSLYRLLERSRPRSFLQRNLRSALESLEHGPSAASDAAALGPSLREQHWCLLSLLTDNYEAMQKAVEGAMPVLRITGLTLIRSDSSPRPEKVRVRAESEVAWLPEPDEWRIPCSVKLAVSSGGEGREEMMKPRYWTCEPATIVRREDGDGSCEQPVFEVVLRRPLVMTLQHMMVVREDESDAQSWKKGVACCHELELSVQCDDSDGAADLFTQLKSDDAEHTDLQPFSQPQMSAPDPIEAQGNPCGEHRGVLWTRWNDLPDTPHPTQMLPLTWGKGSEAKHIDYRALVHMSWNERVSPLATVNRAVSVGRRQRCQLPTPSCDDADAAAGLKCTIKYVYCRASAQTRSVVTQDLACILCRNGARHSSFCHLMIHYRTHHQHMRFEEREDDDASHTATVVLISHDDENRFAGDDSADFQWQAPRTALDPAAYLSGDPTWTPTPLTHSEDGTRSRPAEKRSRVAGNEQAEAAAAAGQTRILPPAEVAELPESKRRRHVVPDVPGVHFYRSISKRVVEAGTEVSDSDDEPDTSWQIYGQRKSLEQLGLDKTSRDFHELFNRSLDAEMPTSDTLARDAIVRFARKYAALLCAPGWQTRFDEKLEQFASRGIIGRDVVEYCEGLLRHEAERKTGRDGGRDAAASSGRVRNGREESSGNDDNGNGDDRSCKTGGLTNVKPKTAPCVCGRVVEGMRGTLACQDPRCGRAFHMACVRMRERETGWRCTSCRITATFGGTQAQSQSSSSNSSASSASSSAVSSGRSSST